MPPPGDDPLETLRELLGRAGAEEPFDATAMALATADADGRPSVRMVLLKGIEGDGLLFFTNYESRKASQLAARPAAAACLYWPTLEVQARAEGGTVRLTEAESDRYFVTRPRESQLGAWASRQSAPLGSRQELEERFAAAEARFAGRQVPRPASWGGYRLVAERIELWYSRPHRLHDRWLYERTADGWTRTRLYP